MPKLYKENDTIIDYFELLLEQNAIFPDDAKTIVALNKQEWIQLINFVTIDFKNAKLYCSGLESSQDTNCNYKGLFVYFDGLEYNQNYDLSLHDAIKYTRDSINQRQQEIARAERGETERPTRNRPTFRGNIDNALTHAVPAAWPVPMPTQDYQAQEQMQEGAPIWIAHDATVHTLQTNPTTVNPPVRQF